MAELKYVLHEITRHLPVRQEAKDELHQAIDGLEEERAPAPARARKAEAAEG